VQVCSRTWPQTPQPQRVVGRCFCPKPLDDVLQGVFLLLSVVLHPMHGKNRRHVQISCRIQCKPVIVLLSLCRAVESQDYAGAVEAYTAALAVDPEHKHVNKQLHLGLCRVQQQLGKGDEAVQV